VTTLPYLVVVVAAGMGTLAWLFAWRAQGRAEARVDELRNAMSASEARGAERERKVADETRETEAAITVAVERGIHDLDEVRLPLHILLENPFGELNDNQIELIGAARDAAEAAAARLRRARDLITLRPEQLRREPVRPGDIVASLVASLQSRGAARGVRVTADLAAPLPALRGDRIRLQEALSVLGAACLAATPDQKSLTITAGTDDVDLVVAFDGGPIDLGEIDTTWAARVVSAHGGSLRAAASHVEIRLPR